ncbi:sensor histidine kinase [Flavobacterium psychrotrophum]|uniref:sensor histidine kinase n=1 Tax=Flavobacterium psychrotrophum TaxID=2294119 RepID=UPI000E31EC8C|nr:ATP-binding protein [Flavobacterium psychrotrophum]
MYATTKIRFLQNTLLFTVFLISYLVIYGWFNNIEVLKSIIPGYISMKFNTALCFIFLSISILIESNAKQLTFLSSILNVSVLIIAATSYSQELFDLDFGIDQLIIADNNAIEANEAFPGRMSPITSILFIIMTLSSIFIKAKKKLLYMQYALHFVTLMSVIATIGYIFHAPDFYTLNFMTSMAVHTSVAFFLLSVSTSLINPHLGLAGIFTGEQVGNVMARRLFLQMFSATFIIILLQYLGHKYNLVTIEFHMATFAIAAIIVNLFIICETTVMLNRKETKKRMAQENFRLVVESAPNALIKFDTKGNIVMINKQAEKMFGYDRELFIRKSIDMLVPDSVSPHYYKNMDYYNLKPESSYFGASRDLYAVRSDGTKFPVEIDLNPITTEGGAMVLASIIDITERKKNENIITNQMIELQMKNKEMEEFNYIASHDLQEPLRTLSNYVTLIEEDYGNELCDELKLHLKTMDNAVSRMSLLVHSILDFGRLGRDKLLSIENCNGIVQNVIEDLGTLIHDAQAVIKIDGTLPTINVYQTELRQLFQNLINNAVKFRRVDAPPEITIGAIKKERFYEFYVKDNGIGINPKHYERIFHIFQRLVKQDQYEGHGIGLANCRKIAEMHGGKIWVESIPGYGSTFKFTISNLAL